MILESVRIGLTNIFANKLRSSLSILGIIFGVGALVATMSIGEGTKQQILSSVEAMGSNLITVDTKVVRIRDRIRTPGLLLKDVELLEEHSPLIELIAPLKNEYAIVSIGGKKLLTNMKGTDPDFEEIFNYHIDRGRFITQKDIEETAKVCVVGAGLAERLEVEDLLGRTIRIKNSSFFVIGVMERLGKSKRRTFNPDVSVIIPISTSREVAERQNSIDQIIIKAVSAEFVETASDQIQQILEHLHAGYEDFDIWTQEEILKSRREYAQVFKIALGSIAIVSLIIGGIGIMNILLASINERIKEIGIRKALGANPLDIMLQFLFESLLLTVSGGIIGVLVGKIMAARIAPLLTKYLPQKSFEWKSVTSSEIVLIAFVFAMVTGFVFGLYPAVKASRLDPSEALTYD